MADKKSEDLVIEARNFFNFYKKEIGRSIRTGKKVILVNFDDIASFSHVLAEQLLSSPEEIFQILELALEDSGLITAPRIRLLDLPETQIIKIRDIRAKHLNQLISIEGIVRQASDVRPQVIVAKFECPSCGTIISVLQIEKRFREPTRCSCGRKGQFNLISKEMVDAQRIVIEESPENLIGGEQPKRISTFLKEDLVDPKMEDRTTPGTRVRIIGVLKEVPVPLQTGAISTRFDLAVEANNAIPLEETFEEFEINEEEERQILELAADENLMQKMSDSIAPSIYGYDEIKQALVLQLFGGVKKKRADGTDTRGDMHILLVGDPGVAKSLSKNEKVLYSDGKKFGYVSIEKLFEIFGKCPKTLKTLTIDMKNHKPKWEKVSEIIRHLPEKDLVKITTEHGKTITATNDHSFITLSKSGEIVPIKGRGLTKEIYVPIPINYHKCLIEELEVEKFNTYLTNSKQLLKKIKLDRDFGFFIGIFLAEGYIRSGNTIDISNKNREIQNKVIRFLKKININYRVNEKGVLLHSKVLSDILMDYCYDLEDLKLIKKGTKGNYSRIKKTPDFSFFAPREFIKGLISGIFSGDGRFIKDKDRIKGFELITLSKELAHRTSDILFSVGIINRVITRQYNYKNKKTRYYITSISSQMIKKFRKYFNFYGRKYIKYPKPIYSYHNCIPCGELVYSLTRRLGYNKRIDGDRTFAAEMRTVRKRNKIGRLRLRRILKRFQKKTKENIKEFNVLKKIAYSPIIWSKIEKIEKINKRKEEVYDLSIPKTNTFVANGIGVHNSVILKFMSTLAPKGRYVVGKSASGAGLTATVVRDEFLRGWALEAGAMVLSNKGLVCIDEIEKMDPQDRSAMHEALEQQCYHYDTIISLADGSEVKIGEFIEKHLEKNRNKIINGKDCFILPVNNLEILTTDFKDIFKTKADRISKHKAFDRFIKLKFSNGREIIVTPEHPVFTAEDGDIITKRADKIKIGDPVPIPLVMPIQGEEQKFNFDVKNQRAIQHIKIPEKNCKEIFKIAGYLISEGSREINRGKLIGINFTNKDQRLLDDFENCMNSVFDVSPYKQIRVDEHASRYMYRYISTELTTFFMKNMPEIMKCSGEKQIPQILMKGEKQNISHMLSTMFEGDGHVSIKERTIRIGYSTKSKRLAEQTQDLLLRFGIRSNLIEDREYFKVLITSYSNLKKFLEDISFITPEKNNIIKDYLKNKTIKRTVKDIIPKTFNKRIIEIIKQENIKQVGKYKQYDIVYDHTKRKDKLFSFSREFLKNLFRLVKQPENRRFLENLIKDIGWEKVTGIEIIENENEDWVYDITIEPSHSFISQASILHNTVTISKANVQATLRAETSVLAAANPKLGRFEPFQVIAQQIDMPPTLLNRFDIIFIMRDLPDRGRDEAIATHVLLEHKREGKKQAIEGELFRKYVAYAKQKAQPVLTTEAVDEIKKFYVELRNAPVSVEGVVKPIPISARQLDALIRLSEASAKARLSKKVKKEDAKIAIELMKYYLMQVGYDQETKTFDIDRIATGISTSQRGRIILVREALSRLESRMGKLIPVEELQKELAEKISKDDIEEGIQKLKQTGDIFEPKKGYVQRV